MRYQCVCMCVLMCLFMCGCVSQGDPAVTIPQLVRDTGAGLLVTDYSPLRLGRTWRTEVRSDTGSLSQRPLCVCVCVERA